MNVSGERMKENGKKYFQRNGKTKQAEFDRRVSKAIETAKSKWQGEQDSTLDEKINLMTVVTNGQMSGIIGQLSLKIQKVIIID